MNDTYMDQRICAFRDTMICYRDDAEQVRVPARAAKMKLQHLGAGALCCPNAKSLELEEGYESIPAETISQLSSGGGKNLHVSLRLPASLKAVQGLMSNMPIKLAGKAMLTRVVLARQLPSREYRDLLETGVSVNGGLRLPVGIMDPHSLCRPLVEALCAGGIGVIEPSKAEFPLFSFDEHGVRPMLFKPKVCLMRDAEKSTATENEVLLRHIASGQWGARSVEAERWNDHMQQTGEDILARRQAVAMIYFDERSAMRVGGSVRFALETYISELFSLSLRRVCLNGAEYYVYARQYCQGEGSQPAYLREDVCVYARDRVVTDPALSEEVYEKYRLLNRL